LSAALTPRKATVLPRSAATSRKIGNSERRALEGVDPLVEGLRAAGQDLGRLLVQRGQLGR
jgi:hypothetical protein